MINYHPLNFEQSEEVYNTCKQKIEAGACYNNIFSVMMASKTKLNSKQWRIAYGYYAVQGNIMARHCFIVNEQGEAIDPTLLTHKNRVLNEDEEYQSFYLIDNLNEYIELISDSYSNPDLLSSLKEKEQEFFEWARSNDKILIGQ
ncbi:hypothetical protein OM416_19540 [Paenibacillus sp. LS1]|uniref:hypothetical protein n=1 Tax=Paenibacillus sp. LS1 TaxID=2992120 RepID=UPI00222F9B5A|nr:hypothetical protein [Paenibacillus sp. LS1]MCW3793790.1 hypothetical protein [Paenibacillus sp. LS1]